MGKIWSRILAALLLVVIVVGIILTVGFLNFMKHGVHTFVGYTRLDFQDTVYFVDADSNVVSGSTTITVSGIVQPEQASGASRSFLGNVSVAQYPTSVEAGYGSFAAGADRDTISITNRNSQQEGVTYWLLMSNSDPSLYAIHIYLEDGTSVTAYPGRNEQDAIANCQAYWQAFQSWN